MRTDGWSLCIALAGAGVLALALAACGGEGKASGSGQVAARVNDAEISMQQVNDELAVLNMRGMPSDEKTWKRVLDRLVDQQLLMHEATGARLDRDPQVMQLLERARRNILSQAYLERSFNVPRPSAGEVQEFYTQYPALFRERRVYTFRDYFMDGAQLTEALRAKLNDPGTREDLPGTLKAANVTFRDAINVQGAEQLPLDMLPRIGAMNKGEISVLLTDNAAVLMQLIDFKEEPVALDKATPHIERYLMNARKKELAENTIKKLRASARIAYLTPSPVGHEE